MPVFSEQDYQRTDYSILQNSPVVMYCQRSLLVGDIDALRIEQYRVLEVDCSAFSGTASFAKHIGSTLQLWGEWHGGLDAFNDYLSDLPFPDSDCLALALIHFDALHSKATEFLEHLVDIFASASRYHAFFGKRLILMLQVDNGRFRLPPVGASPVIWNRKELLDASRTGAAL